MHFTIVAGPRLFIRTKIHIRTVNKLVDTGREHLIRTRLIRSST